MLETGFLVGIFAVLIGCLFLTKRARNYPPGPFSYPIVGNLYQLGTRPEVTFKRWARKYGKIVSLKMGIANVVVIDDWKMIKEAFNDIRFCGKPDNEVINFHASGPHGIISSEGDVWRTQRRFLLRSLREFGYGTTSMETLIMDEVKEILEDFEKTEGRPTAVDKSFGLAVLNSLWTIVCGERFSQKDPKLNEILIKTREAFGTIGKSGLNFVPWLGHLLPKLSGYTKLMKSADDFKAVFREAISAQMSTLTDDCPRNFIDKYLMEMKKTKDVNSSFSNKTGAGVKNLMAVIADIFFAGSETSSLTLNWGILYMASFPNLQKKLQDEIDEVVGQLRVPCLEDRPKMPFTEATIMEILRYSSLIPLGAPHTTTSDVLFHGYNIPKGTWIMGNFYSIHHNPEVWGDPDNFRPQRFLTPDGQRLEKSEALMPFTTGKRQCLGESLGWDTLFLFFVSIFQRFSVLPDPNHFNPKFEVESRFFRTPKPFRVVFKARKEKK